MPRPIWKGAISFGLVTIPVNLYSAIERHETLSFNLLHKKDNARIQNRRFCYEEGVEVPWSEVVKGYEYAKGEYVVVTDEDFEKARMPATQTLDIRASCRPPRWRIFTSMSRTTSSCRYRSAGSSDGAYRGKSGRGAEAARQWQRRAVDRCRC
jgi:Ku70/Ku80 beta-barrel domain